MNKKKYTAGLPITTAHIPYGSVGFCSPLRAHVPQPYFQPLPWDLLALVVATMQAWVLESQPQ